MEVGIHRGLQEVAAPLETRDVDLSRFIGYARVTACCSALGDYLASIESGVV